MRHGRRIASVGGRSIVDSLALAAAENALRALGTSPFGFLVIVVLDEAGGRE